MATHFRGNKVVSRAEIEARRGIVRDNNGRILRSKEWIDARQEMLEAKREDYKQRIQHIDDWLAGVAPVVPEIPIAVEPAMPWWKRSWAAFVRWSEWLWQI